MEVNYEYEHDYLDRMIMEYKENDAKHEDNGVTMARQDNVWGC